LKTRQNTSNTIVKHIKLIKYSFARFKQELADEIEKDLILCGASAIEDNQT